MASNASDFDETDDPAWVQELMAGGETIYPPMPEESRDTFRTWDEIIGNTELKLTLKAFVRQPASRNHVLVYGPNRSGKTWSIHLALQATFCRNPDTNLNPCQKCVSCSQWLGGFRLRTGRYYNGRDRSYYYYGVDGNNPSTFDEEFILNYVSHGCPMILYVDEVASQKFAPYVPQLLKPMTEGFITVLASGVRIKAIKDEKSGKIKPGVMADFRYRFPNIERTSAPPRTELLVWLRQQCVERKLEVEEVTLELILDKARNIPGQALRPLRRAVFLQEPLTLRFVQAFRWDAE